jgi:hypothetical protein
VILPEKGNPYENLLGYTIVSFENPVILPEKYIPYEIS